MNILTTQYSLERQSLDIYLAGCSGPHCEGCYNPESWSFDEGESVLTILPEIMIKIKDFDKIIKNISILGGEPLDQDHDELVELIKALQKSGKNIWLYTRNDIDKVPERIRSLCDYIKTGRYDSTKLSDSYTQYGIKLASTNQRILRRSVDFDADLSIVYKS